MKRKKSPGEYLAFIAAKHELDPDAFFQALLTAGENQRSECSNIQIRRRSQTTDKIVFLITNDSGVIAQLAIPKEFLSRRGNPIRDFMETDLIRKYLAKKTKQSVCSSIRHVRAGMKCVNLKAKVLEVTKPKTVVTRYGNHASLAKALIEDETGKMKLCLWNGQIDAVSPGDTVQIENAQAKMFRGENQLNLGKTGTLCNVEVLGQEQRLQ